ncbi:hypothetical protein REPUB_Repub18cG0084700 [Reevesia pubescens]
MLRNLLNFIRWMCLLSLNLELLVQRLIKLLEGYNLMVILKWMHRVSQAVLGFCGS